MVTRVYSALPIPTRQHPAVSNCLNHQFSFVSSDDNVKINTE